MNTFVIESDEQLSRSVFKSFDDLINEYYESRGLVLLHQIDKKDLSLDSQKKLQESLVKGKNKLFNFQG